MCAKRFCAVFLSFSQSLPLNSGRRALNARKQNCGSVQERLSSSNREKSSVIKFPNGKFIYYNIDKTERNLQKMRMLRVFLNFDYISYFSPFLSFLDSNVSMSNARGTSISEEIRLDMEFRLCKLCIKSFSPLLSELFSLCCSFALVGKKNPIPLSKKNVENGYYIFFMKLQQNSAVRYATLALDTLFTCVIINSKRNIKHPWLFLYFLLTENLFLWHFSDGIFSAFL